MVVVPISASYDVGIELSLLYVFCFLLPFFLDMDNLVHFVDYLASDLLLDEFLACLGGGFQGCSGQTAALTCLGCDWRV